MKKCLICGDYLNTAVDLSFILSFKKLTPKLICTSCRDQFQNLENAKTCIKCGRISSALECTDCQRWNDNLVNRAMFQYNEPMRAFFNTYKFQGDYVLRLVFQEKFVKYIQSLIKEDEMIVPIPIDDSTMQTRGFNQVTGLIEPLKYDDILSNQRSAKSKHQYQRNRRERLQRKSVFQLRDNTEIEGRKIVLVDDIYTTGTTLRQAAAVLKQKGARDVRTITLCR